MRTIRWERVVHEIRTVDVGHVRLWCGGWLPYMSDRIRYKNPDDVTCLYCLLHLRAVSDGVI